MAKDEIKNARQRIQEGEFSQSAEISANYLNDDILIIDNIKVLANPDPVRLQMNMIASCQGGYLKADVGGKMIEVSENDIFVCPPNTKIDIVEVTPDFALTAMCVTSHGMLNILRSHVSVWNRAMYVNKVSIIKMNELDMQFYSKFTELVRLCLYSPEPEHSAWTSFRSEIVETLLKSGLLAVCNAFLEHSSESQEPKSSTTDAIFGKFLSMLQQSETKHLPVEYFAKRLCITSKYLSIVCKRHSGRTAIDWITEYTLSDITYYLRSTSMSIKEVAAQLGFTNTSFFGKYVKEHLHMSPLKYRESVRK